MIQPPVPAPALPAVGLAQPVTGAEPVMGAPVAGVPPAADAELAHIAHGARVVFKRYQKGGPNKNNCYAILFQEGPWKN